MPRSFRVSSSGLKIEGAVGLVVSGTTSAVVATSAVGAGAVKSVSWLRRAGVTRDDPA
jgi:hypothetical protein